MKINVQRVGGQLAVFVPAILQFLVGGISLFIASKEQKSALVAHVNQLLLLKNSLPKYRDDFYDENQIRIDCEQFLFFFRLVRGVHARESDERRSRETRETRAVGSSASRLQSLARSFSCLARFAKKKRDCLWSKIGHFPVPPSLGIKTRLSAQPLMWK